MSISIASLLSKTLRILLECFFDQELIIRAAFCFSLCDCFLVDLVCLITDAVDRFDANDA